MKSNWKIGQLEGLFAAVGGCLLSLISLVVLTISSRHSQSLLVLLFPLFLSICGLAVCFREAVAGRVSVAIAWLFLTMVVAIAGLQTLFVVARLAT